MPRSHKNRPDEKIAAALQKKTTEVDSSATKNPRNTALNRAFFSKSDEFYTQYEDVASEMQMHAANFKNKVVLCSCDNPFESAFFKYFAVNFSALGLKKLLAVCYSRDQSCDINSTQLGKNIAYKASISSPAKNNTPTSRGCIDIKELFSLPDNYLEKLNGDGDFRSEECIALLKQADIVATNPPFSLFREFIGQLDHYGKSFIILGNMNAATTKEIFPLFRNNKVWYGETIRSGDRKFYVPDDYPLNAAGCGIDPTGRRFIRVKGVRWFTNLDTAKRHKPIELKSRYTQEMFPRFENYDAINVSRTKDIPLDYKGVMGVPITFLDKYRPDQFEILMLANGNARTNVDVATLREVGYRPHPEDRGGVGIINGRRVYARILVRRKIT